MFLRVRPKYLFLLFLAILAFSISLITNASSNLDDRLYDVEKKLSGKKPVRPIDADLIKMGGIVHTENFLYKSESYETDNDDAAYDYGDMLRGDLILSGDINPKLEFLVASSLFYFSAHNNFSSANRKMERRYGDYFFYKAYGIFKQNRYFKVMFGRFITPAGTYLETYSPESEMYDLPQFVVSNFGGGLLYNIFADGVNIHGSTKAPGGKLTYFLYSGVQSAFTGSYYDEDAYMRWYFQGYPNKLFTGIRLKYSLLRNKLHLGINYQGGKRREKFHIYGADINFKYKRFHIKAEYIWTKEDPVTKSNTALGLVDSLMTGLSTSNAIAVQTAQGNMSDFVKESVYSDKKTLYIEPIFRLTSKLLLMARYDYVDMNTPVYDAGSKKTLSTLGLIYNPYPQLRLRLHATKIDYKKDKGYGIFDQAMVDWGTGANLVNPAIPAAIYRQTASNALYGNPDQLRINGINPDHWQYQFSATLSF